MVEKHSTYWYAQSKTAQLIHPSEIKDTEKREKTFTDLGLNPIFAKQLVQLASSGLRGKARKLIRQAVELGDEREQMGLSREAPDHTIMMKTLRQLHPSRRKGHGKRK